MLTVSANNVTYQEESSSTQNPTAANSSFQLWIPETIQNSSLQCFRLYNNNLYKLLADRPFITQNLATELTNGSWQLVLEGNFNQVINLSSALDSTSETQAANSFAVKLLEDKKIDKSNYPAFILEGISRTQLPPNTTTDLFIRGFFIAGNETITINQVTVNNISFIKVNTESVMVVNVTTPSSFYPNLQMIINNGNEVSLSETFAVFDGNTYVPSLSSMEAPFVVTLGSSDPNELFLNDGSIRNVDLVGGLKVIKVDLDIPTNKSWSVRWTLTTDNAGETSYGTIGVANKTASVSSTSNLKHCWVHNGINQQYSFSNGVANQLANSPAGNVSGIEYEIKGILNNLGTYDVYWYQNGVLKNTSNGQVADETLNVFFFTVNLVTYKNIEITLF